MCLSMGISEKKVEHILQISQDTVSLDVSVGDDEDSTLSDMLIDSSIINPLEYTENQIYKEKIDALLEEAINTTETIIVEAK